MEDERIIQLALNYTAANAADLLEATAPEPDEWEYDPELTQQLEDRATDLAAIINEDWVNILEVARIALDLVAGKIADLMDISDAELDRIVGVVNELTKGE